MKTLLVKIGGSTIDTPGLLDELAESICALPPDIRTIVVHGGGKDIGRALDSMNKKFEFVEGMRVTDEQSMHMVQMVLSGDVNKRIVNALLLRGIEAVGISGVDGNLCTAHKMTVSGKDIGFVGDISTVNTRILELLTGSGFVPVVSPVSRSAEGQFYNVNADLAAGEIAMALRADHLLFVSDVPGVMVEKKVRSTIACSQAEGLIENGHITGGMIPKIRSAVEAVGRGVGAVHICGWHGPLTLKNELSVETSTGTVIR